MTGQQMTGAQALVESLEHAGAEVVFGLPGGAILPTYDPLMDAKKLRHVLVRHEQGAGHAASGYAHATGKVGVCLATSGPGATNLVTALADANMDSIPMVATGHDTPYEWRCRNGRAEVVGTVQDLDARGFGKALWTRMN